jgi:hypothetical protein
MSFYVIFYKQTQKLSGELCRTSSRVPETACTYIDAHTSNAWWAANVTNVSWFAGSMQLYIQPSHLIVMNESSFVLEYDVHVYDGHLSLESLHEHRPILTKFNQNLWIHCDVRTSVCQKQSLFDISQDKEGLV